MKAVRKTTLLRRLRKDTDGSVFVEAALVMPLVVLVLAAMTDWGFALYQYNLVSNATSEAVRQLIISRGTSTPIAYTMKPFNDWAASLGVTNAMITVQIQDPAQTNYNGWQSPACNDASLQEADCAAQIKRAAGRPAQIAVNVPCKMALTTQFAGLCPIRLTMSGFIE